MGIGFRGPFRSWAGPGIWDGQEVFWPNSHPRTRSTRNTRSAPLSLHELCDHSSPTPTGQPSGVISSSEKTSNVHFRLAEVAECTGFFKGITVDRFQEVLGCSRRTYKAKLRIAYEEWKQKGLARGQDPTNKTPPCSSRDYYFALVAANLASRPCGIGPTTPGLKVR